MGKTKPESLSLTYRCPDSGSVKIPDPYRIFCQFTGEDMCKLITIQSDPIHRVDTCIIQITAHDNLVFDGTFDELVEKLMK